MLAFWRVMPCMYSVGYFTTLSLFDYIMANGTLIGE
jgi:hypothetical protein